MPVDTTAPPRKASAPRPASPAQSKAADERIKNRSASVASLFQLAQFGCVTFGQYADAGALAMHGPATANELAKLAEINPWIGKGIDSLDIVGPWAGLFTALMPLTLQFMVNHGKIAPERVASMGVVPPAMLEAQAKAQLAAMQQQALEAQKAAEAAYADAQSAMNADRRAVADAIHDHVVDSVGVGR